MSKSKRSKAARRRSVKVYQVRITLNGTKPPIWRRVAVRSDITLGELHEVIQIVMGWLDGHLHQFILRDKSLRPPAVEIVRHFALEGELDDVFAARLRGERVFVPRGPEFEDLEMEGEDEDGVTLGEVCPQVKSKLLYEYDFGDGWEHTIEVQKITKPQEGLEYPICLAGKRACPPEDCGGVWGYYEMLEALADPKHERHEELLEWLGGGFDPEAFDRGEVNAMLARWRRGSTWT